MKYGSDFIDKVRDSNDIVDIIGHYSQLKPSGNNLVGLCPFPDHREKSPSFSVSSTKQVYYCFGCKKAGNIFTFVEQMQGLSFPEAVEYLAKRASIPIPTVPGGRNDEKRVQQKNELLRIMNFCSQVFAAQLTKSSDDQPVRSYLDKRRLRPETISTFGLGYAPESWDFVVRALTSKGASIAHASTLGLVKERREKNGYFDIFRNRVIFPILSPSGETIGFGGRAIGDEQPKYLNSPDSPIFHKGQILYGLFETSKYIRAQDQVIVVEGYMDFLSLYQAGIKNVVATLGTALTPDHAKLIHRYTKNVVVMFDGDNAGQMAAERSAPILLHQGLYPRGLVLPAGSDPDDFVSKYGADHLQELLQTAPELFSILMQREMKGFGGTQAERVEILDRLTPVVHATADARLKDLYVSEMASWLNVDKKWAFNAIKKGGSELSVPRKLELASMAQKSIGAETLNETDDFADTDPVPILFLQDAPRAEIELLNLALLKQEYLDEILELHIAEFFGHPGTKQVFSRIEQCYRQMPSEFDTLLRNLINQVNPPSALSLHLEKPFADISKEGAKKLISDCARRIRETYLRAKHKEIASHLRGLRSSEQLDQLEQIMNLQKDRLALKNEPEPH